MFKPQRSHLEKCIFSIRLSFNRSWIYRKSPTLMKLVCGLFRFCFLFPKEQEVQIRDKIKLHQLIGLLSLEYFCLKGLSVITNANGKPVYKPLKCNAMLEGGQHRKQLLWQKIHRSGETEDTSSSSLRETTCFLISFALVKPVCTQFTFLIVMLKI